MVDYETSPPPGMASVAETVRSYIERGDVVGMVTLLDRADAPPWIAAYGLRDRERGEPMTPETLMRIASLTKPITAAATLALVDEGRLTLDDPVANYLPGFDRMQVTDDAGNLQPLEQPITVWHLLTHTAGLGYGLLPTDPVESRYLEANLMDLPPAAIVERLPELPLASQPGTAWRYSIGYDVLSVLVERAADRPFDAYLRDRIFGPLEMVNTGFVVPEIAADRLAALYSSPRGSNGPRRVEDPYESRYLDPQRPRSGGGGLVSTVTDYVQFMRMVLNGGTLKGIRVLQPATVRRMVTNELPSDLLPIALPTGPLAGMGFGLGFAVRVAPPDGPGDIPRGAFWWGGIMGTLAWGDPEHQMSGIALPQAMHYYEPAFAFQRAVYRALRG